MARRPGFGEGFASTFGPTARDTTLATIRELLSKPMPEDVELERSYKRAQTAKLESDVASNAKPDMARVTLTPEIIKGLPTLQGLGLEGKSVTANSLLDIRKAGKTVEPIDQFKVLTDMTTGTRGIDLQTQNPELYGSFVQKRNALAPDVLGIKISGQGSAKAKPGAAPAKPKKTAADVSKEFGF